VHGDDFGSDAVIIDVVNGMTSSTIQQRDDVSMETPICSPDGRSLVYEYRGNGTSGKLRVTDGNGKQSRWLGDGSAPAWQPSG